MANCQNNIRYGRRPMPSPSMTPQPAAAYPARTDGCPCTGNDPLSHFSPAMAYVPWQKWQNIYDTCKGFHSGTIFQDLDKPFLWKGGRCR